MIIKNATECNNFINGSGLSSLDPMFSQLDQCLTKYINKCNCHKKEDKVKLYQTCNSIHYNLTSQTIPRLRGQILQQTGHRIIYFYDNNKLIGSIGY